MGTTRVPRRTTRRTTRASTTTTRPTTSPTTRPTTTRRTTTRAPVIIRRPTTTTPAPFDNFIDDVFEADVQQGGELPSGWVLPPSLMAVAAVPGAPVINPSQTEARVPKDVREEEGERVMMDPYLQFMPVPAVPDTDSVDSQAPRRPKESLSSF